MFPPPFAIFNDIQIDPIDYSPSTLVNALMPMPMMGEQKIVTINGLPISTMKQNEIEKFVESKRNWIEKHLKSVSEK